MDLQILTKNGWIIDPITKAALKNYGTPNQAVIYTAGAYLQASFWSEGRNLCQATTAPKTNAGLILIMVEIDKIVKESFAYKFCRK